MAGAPLVVVGAGMAGTAAAWAASRAGRRVILVHDRAGSSALYSGALDLEEWDAPFSFETIPDMDKALGDSLHAFIAALGIFWFAKVLVATASGVVRSALGADFALLDLRELGGRRVGVADVGRDDWDAPLLAKTLSASDWAEDVKTTFVSVPVKTLRTGHERRIAPYDFAALHDDEQRRASFAEALKLASDHVDAWLLGPWLGLERETVTVLRRLVPLPLGETTSPLGGAAGARFESARDRLLAAQGVEMVSGRVTELSSRGGRWLVKFVDDAVGSSDFEAGAVVLATGGIGAGGLVFNAAPTHGARGFSLPFKAPLLIGLDGDVQGGGGSLYGPSLETVGLGALERAGILTDTFGRPLGLSSEEAGLFVAGDAVAGRPRTMLEAARAGLACGTVATRD